MTTIDAIKTLRANIIAAREAVAAIEAQGLSAPERSSAITKAGPRGYVDVADAEAIAEIQAHPRHWRALRQHVVRGLL